MSIHKMWKCGFQTFERVKSVSEIKFCSRVIQLKILGSKKTLSRAVNSLLCVYVYIFFFTYGFQRNQQWMHATLPLEEQWIILDVNRKYWKILVHYIESIKLYTKIFYPKYKRSRPSYGATSARNFVKSNFF